MAIFNVTNTNDNGSGSLRQAIVDSNGTIGLDTIEFDNSLSGQEITLTSGELQITDDLIINGLGADFLTINGNNASRVFLIDDGDDNNQTEVTIDGLTITGGTSDEGAGIANFENLTLLNSNILDNTGSGVSSSGGDLTVNQNTIANNAGSGISFIYGSLNVIDSTISHNTGLGISGSSGGWEITQSTISDNGSGGISLYTTNLVMTDSIIANNTGTGIIGDRVNFEIDNSIISGNTTTGDGGGISGGSYFFSGTISNSQITNNIADSDGDGNGNGGGVNLYIGGVSIGFTNTIIAGNSDNSPVGSERHPDLSGPGFGSDGYNFVGDITGIGSFGSTNPYNPFTALGDLFGTSSNPLNLANFIEGTSGNDALNGNGHSNHIEGDDGDDTLRGRGGVDVLLGEAGDDSLVGGSGDDTLNGGVGNDRISGNNDNDILLGDDGNDTLNGGAGHDQLFGEADDDRLIGGDGDDTLNGGTGRDTVTGGAGSDRFMLVSGNTGDRDVIRDYQDGVDKLIFTGDLSFNDLAIAQTGNNTRIRETATNQTLAILTGVDMNNLNQLDFEFGAGDNGIRVEAEDYVQFFDTTAGNTGGVYRTDDVDLEATTDIVGGFNVGFVDDGEWLTYNINIAESGSYQVVARVASNTTDGRVHSLDISLDGQSTSLGFDATGGWQSWADVVGDNLNLSAGSHEIRFDMGSSGFNLNYVDLVPV